MTDEEARQQRRRVAARGSEAVENAQHERANHMSDVRIPLKDWRRAIKAEVIADNEDLFPETFAAEIERGATHFVISRSDVRADYLRSER